MEIASRLSRTKSITVGLLVLYPFVLFSLLTVNFKDSAALRAVILMGETLFIIWVLMGGILQKKFQKNYMEKLASIHPYPVWHFVIMATTLACVEEGFAVLITNLAPFYGVRVGEAYITASANYFTVILLHSVIVFIPMFIVLGHLLRRYDISPFRAFLLFGLVGVVAETSFSGSAAILGAPFWILVYGLMVYLPAHTFTRFERKKLSLFLYPILIVIIAFSAAVTAWIPAVLNVPKTEFPPIRTR